MLLDLADALHANQMFIPLSSDEIEALSKAFLSRRYEGGAVVELEIDGSPSSWAWCSTEMPSGAEPKPAS